MKPRLIFELDLFESFDFGEILFMAKCTERERNTSSYSVYYFHLRIHRTGYLFSLIEAIVL